MIRLFTALATTAIISLGLATTNAHAADPAAKNPVVVLNTSKGPITLELYPEQAPVTVANFLEYAKSGFYNDTVFHRVIKRFMIQAGGFTADMTAKETRDPIVNESDNGLHNDRYSVAMARKPDPDSATSQFFINTRINGSLDGNRGAPGYAVFGAVIDGQHVVKAIEKVATHRVGDYADVPVEPIVIESVDVRLPGQ